MDSDNPPIERKKIEVQVNGLSRKIPAIDPYWLKQDNRQFCRYVIHPIPKNGQYVYGPKENWLEIMQYFQDDLKFLLSLEYHKFWSYMIHCKEAHQLLTSFLQEAPPFYLKYKFPEDKEMRDALSQAERLVFLVFIRLSIKKESKICYSEHLGDMLYNNYLFTVPIILDICLIYGLSNRQGVIKLLNNVLTAAPQFLDDFKEIIPQLKESFRTLKDQFQVDQFQFEPLKIHERKELSPQQIKDLILHFYDGVATLQLFLDLHPAACAIFKNSEFLNELASFYSNVIPKVYEAAKTKNCDVLRDWNCIELISNGRIDILKIVKNILSFIINEAMSDSRKILNHVEEYLTIVSELMSESLFISDYHNLYSIEADIDVLTQIYPSIESLKISYILQAISSCQESEKAAYDSHRKMRQFSGDYLDEENASALSEKVSGVQLESLITEVKDILPHLGDGFIHECLKYYNYSTEKVVAAVLESALPSDLSKIDQNLQRNATNEVPSLPKPTKAPTGKVKPRYKNLNEMLDDKTEIHQLKDRYSQLAVVEDTTYDDEFDDTYESFDVGVREVDELEKERRPFVVPRVLRGKEESEESEEEEEEEEETIQNNRDCFVQNPAEWREKQEQKRMERGKRDVVGKAKGQGQDKQVLVNREFKNAHKSFTANHNRRKQASRKRNQGMIPS